MENLGSLFLTAQYDDIRSFHEKFKLPKFVSFTAMPDDLLSFRKKFLAEEAAEVREALFKKKRAEALDGFVDLAYVAMGTYYLSGGLKSYARIFVPEKMGIFGIMGIDENIDVNVANCQSLMLNICAACRSEALNLGFDFDMGWERVHAANMQKIRAKSKDESKRASTWDVVKPEGWTPPYMGDLV